MKKVLSYLVMTALATAVLASCGSGGGSGSYKIKMTTEESGDFSFSLYGSGVATIDWGDGSEKVSLTLKSDGQDDGVSFSHDYPNKSIRTISISGENITGFIITNKILTSLDVSRCTELQSMKLYGTYLTSLDVSKNISLERLECGGGNQLASLDVSKNKALEYLSCYSNKLTSLDVSKNHALTNLTCDRNQLKSLDVSNNTALTLLGCSDNQLTSLDLSKNNALEGLHCGDNQLTTDALNAMFETLHIANRIGINIRRNPGADDCDRSIAESKGWWFI